MHFGQPAPTTEIAPTPARASAGAPNWRGCLRPAATLMFLAMFGGSPAFGQTVPQIQYTYDAAGNLTGITRGTAAKPDLNVSNVVVGTISANLDNSFNIPLTFQVNNVGSVTASPTWYDRGYLSTTPSLTDTAQVLAGFNTRATSLAAGANYAVNATFRTSTTTAPGNYTLFVKADGGTAASGQFSATGANVVDEWYESNNTVSVPLTLPANLKADLTVSSLALGAITVNQNGSYSIPATFQVNNVGTNPAYATWYDRGYLSTDAMLNDTDQVLSGANTRATNLAVGANYPVSLTFVTSASTAPGAYTLFARADGGASSGQYGPTGSNYVPELSETNNVEGVSVTLPGKPDLTVSNLVVGTLGITQSGSYTIPVTFQVNNIGPTTALATWYDRGYLSSNATLEDTDQVLGGGNTRSTNLGAGANYPVSLTFTTSTSTAAGNYTLIVKADGGATSGQYSPTGNNYLAEGNETNNTQSVSIVIPTKPDLVVTNLVVGTITPKAGGGYNIPVTFTVSNTGGSIAVATWYDRGYLSANAVFEDADQILVGGNTRSTNLVAGASYDVALTFTTNATTTAGNYTLIVKADGGAGSGQHSPTGTSYIAESNESNNTASVSVTLP